jgi:hypothetical protein
MEEPMTDDDREGTTGVGRDEGIDGRPAHLPQVVLSPEALALFCLDTGTAPAEALAMNERQQEEMDARWQTYRATHPDGTLRRFLREDMLEALLSTTAGIGVPPDKVAELRRMAERALDRAERRVRGAPP